MVDWSIRLYLNCSTVSLEKKILIVDDEILIAEDLKDILTSFGYTKIIMANDKETAFELLESYRPDVAILDIRMEKEFDGLNIGEHINKLYKIPFIYVTAHSDIEMIKKIVKTNPSGYITKPFKESDLFASINIALEQTQIKKGVNQLSLKDGYNVVILEKDTIDYIESDANYITIYYGLKKTTLRQPMEYILNELNDFSFFRVHRSYIVNLNKVSKYSTKTLQINDITIPISRNVLAEFEEIMMSR